MRVLVTGAAGGIGRAASVRLAQDARARGETARVAVADLRHDGNLDDTADAVRAAGGEAVPLSGNLADPGVPAMLVDQTVRAFGGLDALVSNAGVNSPGPLATLALEEWDRLFDVNTRPTWLLAKAAYPHLKAARGAIVATASMSGMFPHTGLGAYSASKAALIILVKQLAQEWGRDGIRANCVSPGFVNTPMTTDLYAVDTIRHSREKIVPLGRIGGPEDMAAVMSFLLGPDARYVTGQNILTDGGFVEGVLDRIPGRPSAGPRA